ncbi:hypothetical protein D3C72_2240900 [compost metagenome]
MGGRRRFTGVFLTMAVLVSARELRRSSRVSSCSIERTCRRAMKQSSPVTLSHSVNSGMAMICRSTSCNWPGSGRMRTMACS